MPEKPLFPSNVGRGQANVFLAVADALLQRQARDGIYSATFNSLQSPNGRVLCQKKGHALLLSNYSLYNMCTLSGKIPRTTPTATPTYFHRLEGLTMEEG